MVCVIPRDDFHIKQSTLLQLPFYPLLPGNAPPNLVLSVSKYLLTLLLKKKKLSTENVAQ